MNTNILKLSVMILFFLSSIMAMGCGECDVYDERCDGTVLQHCQDYSDSGGRGEHWSDAMDCGARGLSCVEGRMCWEDNFYGVQSPTACCL